MRLLFLTPQLPYPPHQGTTIRNYNLLKGLAARHEIALLSFGMRTELEAAPLRELCARVESVPPPTRSFLQRAVETLLSPQPDMARRLHSPAFAQKLDALLREKHYDVVQIEGIEMALAWIADGGRRTKDGGTLLHSSPVLRRPSSVVFDDHNAEYLLQKTAYAADRRRVKRWHGALYSYIQWRKLARFERTVCLGVNHVVAVSEADARALHTLDARIQPTVIPNGVDVDYYVPSDEVCAKPLAEFAVVFTGKLDFRPNVDAALWFADEILPALRRAIPHAHVAFVGQKPSAKVRALAARAGVEVTGWVADTRPYIADAAVFAAPLRMGGGTRLKVLEAMALGKAIVSTTIGAEGLEYVAGRDLLIADAAEDFARALGALMRDPARRRELGAHARRLAEAKYDWRKLTPRFEEIYVGARPSGVLSFD